MRWRFGHSNSSTSHPIKRWARPRRRRADEDLRASEQRFHALFDTMLEGVSIMAPVRDEDGEIVDFAYEYVNRALCEMTGLSAERMIGSRLRDLFGAHVDSMIVADFRRAFESGQPLVNQAMVFERRTEGQPPSLVLDLRAVKFGDSLLFSTRDVHDTVLADEDTRLQVEQFRVILATTDDGFLELDSDGRILEVNPAYCRMTGYTREELRRMSVDELEAIGTPEEVREIGEQCKRAGFVRLDSQHRAKDGHLIDVEISLFYWSAKDQILNFARDVTELRTAERSRSQLAAIVESSDDAIVRLDGRGCIESWNVGAERLYGYGSDEVLGRPVLMLAAPDAVGTRDAVLGRVLSGGRLEQFETRDQRKDGSVVDVSLTDSPIHDAAGSVVGVARIARDVTEQKRLEANLSFLASRDPLTGLLNRRRLNEELARQCDRAVRYGEAAALLVGDIDNFKYVNDSLGHKAGDELIKRVAQVIAARLRSTDLLARLGGDEFGVLLSRTDLEGALTTAQSLCEAIAAVDTPIDGNRIRMTISFGVAGIEGQLASAEDALTVADLAMYEAKHAGRNRVVAAHAGDERAQAMRVLNLSKRLRSALREQRFELHGQPIVELATGTIQGYELLLRLREGGALVPPDAFIHTAERYGLIGDIDRWVIEHGLELMARDGGEGLGYAINLSGSSIGDQGLLQLIEQRIHERAIDPARLTFEITETAAIADIDAARSFLDRLHQIGCAAALDDFGSGFGSFYYLKYLPFDYLKIDGDFVRPLPGSDSDQLLVKAIVDVARAFDKRTIAEHVSSDDGLALLREYRVDYGQGFHLGVPQPMTSAPSRDTGQSA